PAEDFDVVLTVRPPRFSVNDATAIAERTFGVGAAGARDLGSERDQTFLLAGASDEPLAVMKVSNPAEDPETLDMEALAARRVARVDPTLPVALPWTAPGADPADATGCRVFFEAADGSHWVRMYDVLPGRGSVDHTGLSDAALGAWGETTARLGRALRGFFHPKADRTMLWDPQHALRSRALLHEIPDPAHRAAVERVLDRFEEAVLPVWPGLRAQAVHGDLTTDNALVDDDGLITGIVDFGDMSYSALAIDLASILDSLAAERTGDELFRAARLVVDGYERVTPLEPQERLLLGELWAARSAVTIAIRSWRGALELDDPAFVEGYNRVAFAMLEEILGRGWDATARALGNPGGAGSSARLAERRDRVMGPALEALSYERPIHMASARGVWMTDTQGRTYLDAYNNVPCVGHAHPRVAEAIARQSRTLNTNMRYLHAGAVELAERLVATCPEGLDTVLFVNSGSEANDLAWRLATTATGNIGGLCTAWAYHGITQAAAALSPEMWPQGRAPAHVETWTPPDTYRGTDLDASGFAEAIARLRARGLAPAAAILDGVLTSDGFHDLTPAYAQELVRLTREAGGLWIADEVQGGHGRTGEAMWSFQRHGIEPDVVTLGKPMGNGHPVAAVITRREIARRFAEETVFFSTFGGNPVSIAAAAAVLDVLEDERVLARTQAAGEALRAAVREVATVYTAVGDVRGVGLANGIELVRDPSTKEPDAAAADAITEGLRERGVLVGTTGPQGNVLKVRPPLAFTRAEVPVFADALAATLEQVLG
ncbi:MAG: aminotransferase class III-fold pyridoxal phosphate-dependent enzyme, partial [Actinomycetota bacterium]